MIKNKNIAIVGWYGRTTEIARILSRKNNIYRIAVAPKQQKIEKNSVVTYLEKDKYGKILQKLKRCYLIRNNIDIFHMHMINYAPYKFIDSKTPLVITVHGYLSLEAIANQRIKENSIRFKFLRWIEKKGVEKADAVIAVDSTIKNFVIRTLNAEKDKVFCIPNGVNIDKFSPYANSDYLRNEYIKNDEKLIVCLREFDPKNGVFIVLEAMNILINEKKEKKAKLILGGGGPLENDFKKYIKEKKLLDYVTILGHIPHEDIPKYFAAADLTVNTFTHIPYVEEQEVSSMLGALDNNYPIATSNTTLEALAAGKCTIVCTVGGRYSGVHSSDPGILLSDEDPNLLAQILSELIYNDELRTKIGKNGREYVVSNRSWEIIVKEIENVYSCVLKGSS